MKALSFPALCLLGTALLADAQPPPPIDAPAISEQSARWELARVLRQDERIREAEKEYRRLLEANPDLLRAREELAALLAALGQDEEALKLLESVPAAERSSEGWKALASILETKGNFAESSKIYRELLLQDPSDEALRFRLAQTLSWQKDYPGSIREFEILVRARPDDLQLLRHYARVLGWAGKNREAIEMWRKTLPAEDAP
jgi:tetratricopeptide (TPR) repeat protein